MQQIVFFNGPPRSGKDTLAKALAIMAPAYRVVKFAKILKERTHALYGLVDLPHDFFESTKDIPQAAFMGLSPRQAYINVSERCMKPVHGDEVFGRLLLGEISFTEKGRGFLISDSGFAPEAMPIINHYGAENCLLVRIHAEDRGCSFSNDSRGYIELPVETIDLQNNSTQDSFVTRGLYEIGLVLQQRTGGR